MHDGPIGGNSESQQVNTVAERTDGLTEQMSPSRPRLMKECGCIKIILIELIPQIWLVIVPVPQSSRTRLCAPGRTWNRKIKRHTLWLKVQSLTNET